MVIVKQGENGNFNDSRHVYKKRTSSVLKHNEDMKNLFFSHFFFIFISFCFLFLFCHGIESPPFTIVHSESDFEIRLYGETSWLTASVQTDSFQKATKEGFHRLFQYIHGANVNSLQLVMTAPILTSISTESQSFQQYFVRFYLSTKFKGGPPSPLPDLNLQLVKWGSHCVVVRKFSGFATDSNTIKELENLSAILERFNSTNPIILEHKHTYNIAQYNSSIQLVGRLNEVWMSVAGYAGAGC